MHACCNVHCFVQWESYTSAKGFVVEAVFKSVHEFPFESAFLHIDVPGACGYGKLPPIVFVF